MLSIFVTTVIFLCKRAQCFFEITQADLIRPNMLNVDPVDKMTMRFCGCCVLSSLSFRLNTLDCISWTEMKMGLDRPCRPGVDYKTKYILKVRRG